MSISTEVAKTISRLRAEAKDKLRLADELQRTYTGEDPKQLSMGEGWSAIPAGQPAEAVTVDTLIAYLRKKGARPSDLALHFNVAEGDIKRIIATSGGRLYSEDWRGWVKILEPTKIK